MAKRTKRDQAAPGESAAAAGEAQGLEEAGAIEPDAGTDQAPPDPASEAVQGGQAERSAPPPVERRAYRFTQGVGGASGVFDPGREYSLPAAEGDGYVRAGWCVPVEAPAEAEK